MPKLKIDYKSSLSAEDTFKKVSDLLSSDEQLKGIDQSFTCSFDSASLTGEVSSKLFTANMNVKEANPGSNVELTIDLPMKLALAKGMIEKTLQKKLEKALA